MQQATIQIDERVSDHEDSAPSASNGGGDQPAFVFRFEGEEFVPARTFKAISGISHSTLLRYTRQGIVRRIPVGRGYWYGLGAIMRQRDLLASRR